MVRTMRTCATSVQLVMALEIVCAHRGAADADLVCFYLKRDSEQFCSVGLAGLMTHPQHTLQFLEVDHTDHEVEVCVVLSLWTTCADLDSIVGVKAAPSFLQDFPATTFSSASLAHDEVAVANGKQLVQLRHLFRK